MPGISGQNGAAQSNGAVLEAQFTERRNSSNGAASSNGSSNGAHAGAANGSSAGRSALIQEVTEADSLAQRLANGSYAGAGSTGASLRLEERPEHWADPCEVGQLEACAQERYAGAKRPRAGMLASPGQNGSTPPPAAPAYAARALPLLACMHHLAETVCKAPQCRLRDVGHGVCSTTCPRFASLEEASSCRQHSICSQSALGRLCSRTSILRRTCPPVAAGWQSRTLRLRSAGAWPPRQGTRRTCAPRM